MCAAEKSRQNAAEQTGTADELTHSCSSRSATQQNAEIRFSRSPKSNTSCDQTISVGLRVALESKTVATSNHLRQNNDHRKAGGPIEQREPGQLEILLGLRSEVPKGRSDVAVQGCRKRDGNGTVEPPRL